MAKEVTHYICQKCGGEFPKWLGKCPSCGEWNSLVETVVSTRARSLRPRVQSGEAVKPLRLDEVKSKTFSRIKTGIGELDRVLGAGIVPASVILVAGEPGMGKSTLLTQLALRLATSDEREILRLPDSSSFDKAQDRLRIRCAQAFGSEAQARRDDSANLKSLSAESNKTARMQSVLYVCGEESPAQVKMRVKRFIADSKWRMVENLLLLPEINVENIREAIEQLVIKQLTGDGKGGKKDNSQLVVIVDSIQTLFSDRLSGLAGSVGQIRECAQELVRLAKSTGISIFIVGHVTKEGAIAGPKILEHMVDTVLYLEGDGQHEFRIVRCVKNRFGPTDEVGVFLMRDSGLEEVSNPSGVFLSERQKGIPGSAVVVSMQGARPVLTEIQALVDPTSITIPRRLGSGVDLKRLQVLCAVLSRRAGLRLSDKDVYVNVAGGLNLREPAVDLGICLAIASSCKNKPVSGKAVAIGEVGLLGEIRRVSFMERRVKEAKTQGFSQVIGPDKYRNIGEVMGLLK